MINIKNTKIQLSRSNTIAENREVAELMLSKYNFLVGELVTVNYKLKETQDDFRSNIGTLIAIGIKNGIGRDCYRVLNTNQAVVVDNILEDLPDVSNTVDDQLFLSKYNGAWNYVYIVGQIKTERAITGGPFIFYNMTDGYRWFYYDQRLKREDDFHSKKDLNELLQKIINSSLQVDVISSEGNLFRAGDNASTTLEFNIKDGTGIDILDECEIWINGEKVDLNENTYTIENINTNAGDGEELNIQVRRILNDDVYLAKDYKVNFLFGKDFYFGVVNDDWDISEENILNLETKLSYKTSFVWDGIELNNQKTVFAYPKKYGILLHIYDDHGLDYINTYRSDEVNIGEDVYYCYVKSDLVTISNLCQKYLFIEDENFDLEKLTLLDIITSWKHRNSANNFVTLDEDGKINTDFYSVDASASFIKLKDILETTPISNLEPGAKYFIKDEGKIYTASSTVDGTYSDAVRGVIYVCDGKFYSLLENSIPPELVPFTRFKTVSLNSLDDLWQI